MNTATIPHKKSAQRWLKAPMPRHLTQSISLEESPLPPLLSVAVAMIGTLLFVFLFWASFTYVEEIASAAGQVVPSSYVQSIQHPDGGVVKDIMVEDGQLVEQGQELLRLDGTNANADLGQMLSRQKSLQLNAARLRSFVANNNARTLDEDQTAILNSMREARAGQQKVLQDQIAQKQKELKALDATRSALQKNVALMDRETRMHEEMAVKGIGSQLTAITSERQLNQMRGQLEETVTGQTRARDAINEAQSRSQSLDADLKQEAMKTLGQVEAELDEVNKSLSKVESAADRTTIKAPVRGVIKGLALHTLGAVVEPGKILMEIVPVEKNLLVEAMVQPSDIGNLALRQPVKIKVSAYDFSRFGNVPGFVQNISATTFQTEKGESYYKVKIKLEQPYVGNDPTRNLILPGMTVQAGIVTGNKTVLQYLLKPLQVATDSAFHER